MTQEQQNSRLRLKLLKGKHRRQLQNAVSEKTQQETAKAKSREGSSSQKAAVEIIDSDDSDERMTLTQRKAAILAEKKDRSVSGINIRTPNTAKNTSEREQNEERIYLAG